MGPTSRNATPTTATKDCVPAAFDPVTDSCCSRLNGNAVSCGIVIPLALVLTRSTALFRYLRRSVLEFDGVRAFEERLRRAGDFNVRTETMDGWQRGITHTFLAEAPPS